MDFSARLAGLKILARFQDTGLGFRIFGPGWIAPRAESPLHVIENLILRGFVSEAGLKFQPGMTFAM